MKLAKLLIIIKIIYNNSKNNYIRYISFKLNFRYYFYIFYKNNIKFYSKYKQINKSILKYKNLIIIYKKKHYYMYKLL